MYSEDELLALSGVQHFAFCQRQWALIHIAQAWSENYLTAAGRLAHKRAHDGEIREKRGSALIVRGLAVQSLNLGLYGVCDVVEFRQQKNGIALFGEDGTWMPKPVEYKHGSAKANLCDKLQVCAQAMCLEEMLACEIAVGYLFYKKTQSREKVELSADLRDEVKEIARNMHALYKKGHIPHVKASKSCNACSLNEQCLPLLQKRSAKKYIDEMLGDVQ